MDGRRERRRDEEEGGGEAEDVIARNVVSC